MSVRVATDVGGTFTDLVQLHTDPATGRQEIRTAKSDTTPPDFERGVLEVIARSSVAPGEIDFLVHGTTVVINALTERKGVTTGLITTEGFRDSLEIARGNRPDFFNLFYVKPEPFVPRALRRELPGRLAPTGAERAPLDLAGLEAIVGDFRAAGVEAVAICLLHAYANPAHEVAVLERLRALWPGVSAVASHQITREWREYERSSTAVLSAYVQPIAERYLSALHAGVAGEGFRGAPYIMQSNCGVDTLEHVKRIPITMVESGPASGFWGAAELGRLIGEPNVLALDIGGTTAKCSLIEGGHVKVMTDYWIERDGRSAGLPDHGAGRRPRRDRQRRRQHRLGRRLRQAARRPAVGGRRAGARRLRPGRGGRDDDRREPRARADQPGVLPRRRGRGHGRGRPRPRPSWPSGSAARRRTRRAGSSGSPTTTWSTR